MISRLKRHLQYSAADTAETLEIWHPIGSVPFDRVFQETADNYSHFTSSTTIQHVPGGRLPGGEPVNRTRHFNEATPDFVARLISSIDNGDPPDAAIIWSAPAELASLDLLTPLDPYMKQSKNSQKYEWSRAAIRSCSWNNTVYGLPASAGSYCIFYNQDMLERRGLPSSRQDFPKTWDDLKDLSAEFVNWDGDTLVQAGMIPFHDAVQSAIWSATNGGTLYNAPSESFQINSDQNVEMLDYARRWLHEQYRGNWTALQKSGNYVGDGYVDNRKRPPAFQSGHQLALVSGFWLASDMYEVELDGWQRWNVAKFPIGPSGTETASGFWPNWCVIPKNSRKPKRAFSYLDYLVGPSGMQTWFSQVPDYPANLRAREGLIPQQVADRRGEEFATELTNFFATQLETSVPMWSCPVEDRMLQHLQEAIDDVLKNGSESTTALVKAQQRSERALEAWSADAAFRAGSVRLRVQ